MNMEPTIRVELHPHAIVRLKERGSTADEVIVVVQSGERFPAKHGRAGFRLNMPYDQLWNGRFCRTKQVEAFAVLENNRWLVITVIVKFF